MKSKKVFAAMLCAICCIIVVLIGCESEGVAREVIRRSEGVTREEVVREAAFYGKRWLVIGDSISESNFHTQKNYHTYVSEWLHMEVVNVAASGTGFNYAFQGNGGWLSEMENYPVDIDIITIMGGLNDRHYAVGAYGDETEHTFYGSLKLFFDKLIEKYPNTPIGVITSTPRLYCWGERGEYVEHINAVITMSGEYSLPVLDLYRSSGLRPWNEDNNKEYFSHIDSTTQRKNETGDGVHLNDKGHLLVAYKVYDFMLANLIPTAK
ncbi:MAG: SGNH/GDSL hydrolase family protein [Candidatus Pelethousia sp.]|nr:SGNH/GDSL hydrolase family protein [Candidatus Pelethousia sp.]